MPNQSKLAIAQNLLGLRFKRKQVSPFFMYCQMDSFRFRHDVDARLVVTVQASIKRKDLETIDLLKPTIEVQDAFEKIVKPIFQKQIPHENRSLEFLRDTLLPKLLSGEIDLTNNQKEVVNG
ncbi:restriction endonuclease subunit S domain-containing protein [Pseudoalteromonas gelatinilytica]